MELNAAKSMLTELEKTKKNIILLGQMEVLYSGRAESTLALGDRILLIKSDRTILIHQPTGSTPVNYLKEGSSWSCESKDEKLVISASNSKENLLITITKVHELIAHELEDGMKLALAGSEREMADMIIVNPHLIGNDFRPVSREEQTKYGFVDVLGTDSEENLVVVECKRYAADLAAVTQLRRYVERMMKSKGIDKVKGIIAAPKISANAKVMLEDWGFTFKEVNPPKYLAEYKKSQSSLKDYSK